MEGRGKTWRVGYNLQTGALTGRPADSRPGEPLSTRRFLTRLHMIHGYPSGLNARWFWAVAVDLMFVSMVGWGLTGLLMWWQMKNMPGPVRSCWRSASRPPLPPPSACTGSSPEAPE